MTKVLLVANTDWYLYNFRLSLAGAIRARGMEVVLISPPGPYSQRILERGFRWIGLPFSRTAANPLSELLILVRWARLYAVEKPTLVHHFTIKPIVYGSLAARWAGVRPVVNAVTGLGYLFTSKSRKARALRRVVLPLYRLAMSGRETRAVFQNEGDRTQLGALGVVEMRRATLIKGSGVDTGRFFPVPEPPGPVVILMAARMLWDKGVGDLVEASRALRARGIQARTVLVGEPDLGNPSSVSAQQLRAWQAAGDVEWWGRREDMPSVYAQAHVVVLPSYGEGVPRSLLEAAAMGRPIVATDLQGCREVVYNGESGYLVRPRDPQALCDALARLAEDPALRTRMGARGREIVLERFTDEFVNGQTLSVYVSLLGAGTESRGVPDGSAG